MTGGQKRLCIFYGAVALVALVATWSQNVSYFQGVGDFAGFLKAFGRFILDTTVNPAARSITVDLGLFFLAAAVFMIREARRLGIGGVWAYILFGYLVAISVTFPMFLIARERALTWEGEASRPASTPPADLLGMAAMTLAILGLCAFVLTPH